MGKISYSPLKEELERIEILVKNQRFRNVEAFIDRAVQILLAWELEPLNTDKIIQGYPLSELQKSVLKQKWKESEYKKTFEKTGTDEFDEGVEHKKREQSSEDHKIMTKEWNETENYLKSLDVSKPENTISYDGYPILFRLYSRFLPAKIVLCTLAHLLRERKTNKIKLKEFKVIAFDIAEEYSQILRKYESENHVPRNERISTGLPRYDKNWPDERRARVQKRFKDQYVGITRENRKTKIQSFEGILAALGLVYITKEKKDLFISLTKDGKDFCLSLNAIWNGGFEPALTSDESKFIIEKLLPKLQLEECFVDVAMETVDKYSDDPILQQEKMTEVLDEEFFRMFKEYEQKNPEKAEQFNFGIKSMEDEDTRRKIRGWRVATMGRLAEIGIVDWSTESGGISSYEHLDPLTN